MRDQTYSKSLPKTEPKPTSKEELRSQIRSVKQSLEKQSKATRYNISGKFKVA